MAYFIRFRYPYLTEAVQVSSSQILWKLHLQIIEHHRVWLQCSAAGARKGHCII